MKKFKFIHYINQFFGQMGGEDKAYMTPIVQDGSVGPGKELQKILGEEGEIVATIICGDTYFNENLKKASDEIMSMISKYDFDGFIAGPAFNAGRYGIACGEISKAVQESFGIKAVASMYPENPGVEIYSKYIYILKTGNSAVSMRNALKVLGKFSLRLVKGEEIGFPEEEGYIPQGRRVNVFMEQTGAIRGINMLLKKLRNENFKTELPMPVYDRVSSAPAINDVSHAVIALVTSGGIVPRGNPDRIESANATKYGRYSIKGIDDLEKEEFITVHGGYDPVYALEDPDRIVPVDAMRILEKEGRIGKLYDYIYTTVGNTTAVSSAEDFGRDIAEELLEKNIDGVILTST